jgi:hypothetical protein
MNQQHSSRLRTALDTDFFIYQFKTELCTSVSKTFHTTASCCRSQTAIANIGGSPLYRLDSTSGNLAHASTLVQMVWWRKVGTSASALYESLFNADRC